MFDLYISFHILLARSCTCYQLDIFLFEIKYIFILRKDLTAFIINYMIFELSFPKSLNNETLHCNIFFVPKTANFCLLTSPLFLGNPVVHWMEKEKKIETDSRQVPHFKYFATRYSEYK